MDLFGYQEVYVTFYMAFRTVKKMHEVAHWAAFIHQRILSIRMTKVAQPESYKHQSSHLVKEEGQGKGKWGNKVKSLLSPIESSM